MTTLVYEEWGEHEALLIRPRPSGPEIEPPVPKSVRLFREGLSLELGGWLPYVDVRFETYGPREASAGATLIFHALTGSAHAAGTYRPETLARLTPLERAFGAKGWWNALVGPGKAIDTERRFVVVANVLGSCYGTTGPLSEGPDGEPYGPRFPEITIRDMARVQRALLDFLGVRQVDVVGGSMGGMLALEFAVSYPERTRSLAVFAAPLRHGAWARGLSELGRMAILEDREFASGYYAAQPRGLALARAIAMMGYRHPRSFELRWGHQPQQAESYLRYQGDKFVRRFDANTYLTLLAAMDRHDVGRGRGGLAAALDRIAHIPSIMVGIDSDLLYPAEEVKRSALLAGSEYAEIRSPHGHDAFLIESDQVSQILTAFGY